MKRGLIAGSILVLILLCIAPTLSNWAQGIGEVLADFELGHGRRITIFSHIYWEVNRTLYFRVLDGSRLINDGCLVESDLPGDPHRYAIVQAENRSVVGVLDYELATPLFIMCDFESGKCWPCDDGDYRSLFERLKAENPVLGQLNIR